MAEVEWPNVGDAVAVVELSRGRRAVRSARVDRIGKRDIVLDNGERFRVATLTRREGDTWSSRTSRLMRPDDPKVTEVRQEIRRANLLTAAKRACNEFGYTGSVRGTELTAADVILALAPLTGVADEIAALFTADDPRAAVAGTSEGA